MSEHQASRTLLKSPPELWAECSDAQSLARHLDDYFGEIQITRLEPEQAVAWEGERVSGTVKLEPSGWGTKVTLTATASDPAPPEPFAVTAPEPPVTSAPPATAEPPVTAEPPAAQEPEPETARPEPPPRPARMGFIGRLRYLLSAPVAAPPPAAAAELALDPVVSITPGPITVAAAAPPESPALEEVDEPTSPEAAAALAAALDSLGKAHHRPFSRG